MSASRARRSRARPSGPTSRPRVVAGRHGLAVVQVARPAEQRPELHVRVAVDARAGRPPVEVGVEERLEHAGVELALEVHDVERDAELGGDPAGVVGGIERAAALLELGVRVGDVVQAHPDADDLVPCSWSSAAATEESTPPDIATRIRLTRARPARADRPRPRRVPSRIDAMHTGHDVARRRRPPRPWSFGRARAGARRAPLRPGSPSRSARG